VSRRAGLTLVELLVVIAIIGVLVAMMLPAVQMARESARKMSCRNHLRQIGLALHNHHSAKGHFPAGNFARTAGQCPGNSRLPSEDRANWAISILPYIEHNPLYGRYDDEVCNEADENRSVRETYVAAYVCPSDLDAGTLVVPAMGPAASWGLNVPYMTGSYRAVSGRSDGIDYLDNSLITSFPRNWRGPMHIVGILGFEPERLKHLSDGASHTLMVGEATSRSALEYGTLWAYSFSFYSLSAGTPQARTLLGDYDFCRQIGGPGHSYPCRRAWGSPHPGGIQFLTCDGAVHTIPTDIDMELFAELTTIAGGEAAQLPLD